MSKFITRIRFIIGALLILILTNFLIILDIPIIRQLYFFAFLTFLPGIIFLKLTKIEILDNYLKIILSVAVSVSFLLIGGIVLNQLSVNIGIENPISLGPLIFLVNALLILFLYSYRNFKAFNLSNKFCLNFIEKLLLSMSVLLPFLTIVGTALLNDRGYNNLIIFEFIYIIIILVLISVFQKILSQKIYSPIIYLISVSIVVLFPLRCNHIIGSDCHEEYYLFQMLLERSKWMLTGNSILNSSLAVTLLPAIYQKILNIEPEIFFRFYYSFIASLTPLAIYSISRKYVTPLCSFYASCFFVFQHIFFITDIVTRSAVATFFEAMIITIMFNSSIGPTQKRLLIIIFGISIVFSHYSSAYIFFFILAFTFVCNYIFNKRNKNHSYISLRFILLFFALIFFWYSYYSNTTFNSGIYFLKDSLESLNNMFLIESRNEGVKMVMGVGISEKGIPHKVELILSWITFSLIGLGILGIIIRHINSITKFFDKKAKIGNHEFEFEFEYIFIAISHCVLLLSILIIPYFAGAYSMDRLYSFALPVLSIFFVLGCLFCVKIINYIASILKSQIGARTKEKSNKFSKYHILVLAILIPYILSVSGITYHFFGYDGGILMNSNGEQYNSIFIHDSESSCAKWLNENMDGVNIIFSDFPASRILQSQGLISMDFIDYSWMSHHLATNGYVFLRYENNVKGLLRDFSSARYDVSNYFSYFQNKNKIYDSRYTDILR